MTESGAAAEILACERSALERWSAGDPVGYGGRADDDIVYYDDIGAQNRVVGIEAVRAYTKSLEGQIPPHDYEMVDPHVQMSGEVGVLSFKYQPLAPDGTPLTAWRATTVYRRSGEDWKMFHAHWTMLKADAQ